MSFYEEKIGKGEMTLDQAMFAIKDAYERKQNFEEMGYILPTKKTEYPYWAEEGVINECCLIGTSNSTGTEIRVGAFSSYALCASVPDGVLTTDGLPHQFSMRVLERHRSDVSRRRNDCSFI